MMAVGMAVATVIGVLLGHVLQKGEMVRRYLAWSAIALLAIVLVDVFVFNRDAVGTFSLTPVDVSDEIKLQEGDQAELDGLSMESKTVEVTFRGPNREYGVEAYLKDESSSEEFMLADERTVIPESERWGTRVLRLRSKGNLKALRLRWGSIEELKDGDGSGKSGLELTSVRINVPMPYRPGYLRFALVGSIALFALAIRVFELWRIRFDPNSRRQKVLYAVCGMLMLCPVLAVNILTTPKDPARFPLAQAVEYPFQKPIEEMDNQAHAIMFDTLFHGGVVQSEPPSGLLELENPYDFSKRKAEGVSVLWDYALFNGRVYTYFGMTPVLVVYAPYYLLFGVLPSYVTAALILALVATIGVCLTVWETARRFASNTSFLGVALSFVSVALGSCILMLQSCTDKYYLSCLSTAAFFFLTLWSALFACRLSTRAALPMFALSGLFSVLLVWSRAGGFVSAAGWLLPLFVGVLLDKELSWRERAVRAGCYLVPALAGAAAICYFNAIRFGSPLDFGQSYQLTVSDVRYNTLDVGNVLVAMWYYLCNGINVSADFPWVVLSKGAVNHTGNYMYYSINFSVLVVPITWGLFVLRVRDRHDRPKVVPVLAVALLAALVCALMDYCVGGVHIRYVCDILPTLCLLGSIGFMRYIGQENNVADPLPTGLLVVTSVLTAALALSLTFGNERNYIRLLRPDAYTYVADQLSIE